MKDVDPYYCNYSSMVQYAGSHYDNVRIKKANEFDMDIVIRLPVDMKVNRFDPSQSDIIIEPKSAGFLHLKMGTQFQNLPIRDKDKWQINQTAYKWKDENNYLLHTKFLDWFRSTVNKALNTFPTSSDSKPYFYCGKCQYIIEKSGYRPAFTVLIKNESRNFHLDVDLVPAIKLPEGRWPIGNAYRHIPYKCRKGHWMVVGKPDKSSLSKVVQDRSWRIALHYQERELMHNTYNLRQGIRLIKQLRDILGMTKIASYYIKTLFLWEVAGIKDKRWWRNSPAVIFYWMVRRLYDALEDGIPNFWNPRNNLIKHVPKTVLDSYALKLAPLIRILEEPSEFKSVAKYLMTPEEFAVYNTQILRQ